MSKTTALTAGSFCHVEIPVPNLEGAIAFFTGLFDWELSPIDWDDDAALFETTTGIAGVFFRNAQVANEGTVVIIAVDDIEKKFEQIKDAGGEIVTTKTEAPGGQGAFGHFRDPNGNKSGLWQSAQLYCFSSPGAWDTEDTTMKRRSHD